MSKGKKKPTTVETVNADVRETEANVVIGDGSEENPTFLNDTVEESESGATSVNGELFANSKKKTVYTVVASSAVTALLVVLGFAVYDMVEPEPVNNVITVDSGEQYETFVDVAPEDIDGKTIEVMPGTEVTLDIPNPEDTINWQGQSSDNNVAAFIAGARLDNLLIKPAVFGNSPGTSIITLTNQSTGEILIFNIVVLQP